MPRRRVLLVEEASGSGGAIASLESLAGSSPAAAVAEFVIALGSDGPAAARLRDRGFDVRVISVQGWRWWERSWRTFVTAPLQIASLVRWIRLFKSLDPDIVHLNSNRLVEPLIAARATGVPAIVHFRDVPSRMTPRFVWGRRGFFALMNQATGWIANSETTASDICPRAQVPVTVIVNGIDLDEYDRWAAKADRRHAQLHVAMIALINRLKNVEAAVDVAAAVLRTRDDVVFSIAGDGDPVYISELKARAADRGIDDRFTFAGHVDNVPAYLRSADVLLHTCAIESFGRVFLEAMAGARPVVAFRAGAAAEVVVDGETGLLAEPGDITGMSARLLALLNDPALRDRLGRAGRTRVQRKFSIQQHRARVAVEYERAIAAGNGR